MSEIDYTGQKDPASPLPPLSHSTLISEITRLKEENRRLREAVKVSEDALDEINTLNGKFNMKSVATKAKLTINSILNP